MNFNIEIFKNQLKTDMESYLLWKSRLKCLYSKLSDTNEKLYHLHAISTDNHIKTDPKRRDKKILEFITIKENIEKEIKRMHSNIDRIDYLLTHTVINKEDVLFLEKLFLTDINYTYLDASDDFHYSERSIRRNLNRILTILVYEELKRLGCDFTKL